MSSAMASSTRMCAADPGSTRRRLLLSFGVTAASLVAPAVAAIVPEEARIDPMTGLEPGDTPETVFLRTRLDDSMVEQRWNALPFSPNQLYYPSWVFGEFRVTSVLRKKTLPFGQKASPLNLQRDGSFRCGDEEEGDELEVRARYFSTLADSLENNVRVNLGLGAPSASIIEDRAFNARELSAAVVEDGGQGVAGT